MGWLRGRQKGLARWLLLPDLLRPRLRRPEEDEDKEEDEDAEEDEEGEVEDEDAVRLKRAVRPARALCWLAVRGVMLLLLLPLVMLSTGMTCAGR